ncbi:MAG: metallophosphoesterase family protein [Deltaproteobacteria bacterium]|nr:metallophosphoesterase family protein [Deltaproteobacteria bacterium]
MKIGVLSDTHLTRVTPTFKQLVKTYFKDVDLIFHAGDMVGLPVYEFLQSLAVEAVRGNMDEGNLKAILPDKKTLSCGGKKIGLIHGWGAAQGLEGRLVPEFDRIDCLVYGHSHNPANHWVDGVLHFNPGSASGIGFFGKPTIGFLHINDSEIKGEILEL